MRTSMFVAARYARLLLLALAGAVVMAGCSDTQPLAGPAAPPVRLPETVVQAFDCTASIATGVRCDPARGSAGGGSAVIIGGYGVFVQLASSNVSFDNVTGIFQFDVTVKNLLNEALGSPNGVVADPEGIRVFFHSGPTAVGGTGMVFVENPDGYVSFTAANQPYFAWHEILPKNAVSSPKTWRLAMDPGVTAVTFKVYVETDLQQLLVVNEVFANPGGAITDANGEWFEVYNAGVFPVYLQGLLIADSASAGRRPYHTITAPLALLSGEYVVLGNTLNTTSNGGVPVDYAYGSALALANSLDAVKISLIYGSDTITVDRAEYASAAISAKNGVSRELINPGLDNANIDGANWADASVSAVYGAGGRGTPKAQNSAFVP